MLLHPAQTGVAPAIFTMMALVTMGILLFGGRLSPREITGIAMSVGAMLLMTRLA